ncbi:hypothetical protein GN244_ATG08832 [Phytophthora infestans]|uniref:PH domain-containing protein n=1 Tax=Phytophthora infestans TaxID=4787 RepID=A0A833SRP4_PHYIN|nr:hypothetical protein GN244_ATG08832 [Phytophthora infestans]KAF4143531.1 hypothetical protein GN958_ATG07264 [Phytophthora infestans]
MTYGKVYVQSCSRLWFLSTVYLACTQQAKFAGSKHATQAIYSLVILRPRIAGGTMTIPLNFTVKFAKIRSRDVYYSTIRLTHGSSNKKLVLRASGPQEREQWVAAIAAALSVYRKADEHATLRALSQSDVKASTSASGPSQHTSTYPRRPSVSHATPASSLRRMVRRNLPAAMQLFISVGQMIASAG